MQVQIKRQVKIELDQADITEAVRAYLAGNGYAINAEDLAKINFVKSPKDGLRAELNITEESGDAPVEAEAKVAPLETSISEMNGTVLHQTDNLASEAPGEIPAPTVEDVAPEVKEAVDLVLQTDGEGVEEQSEPEPEVKAEAPRTKLFM